ncbi:hypothetical protein GCM10017744_101150 [Streptomyces antimycoticus]
MPCSDTARSSCWSSDKALRTVIRETEVIDQLSLGRQLVALGSGPCRSLPQASAICRNTARSLVGSNTPRTEVREGMCTYSFRYLDERLTGIATVESLAAERAEEREL